MIKSPTSGPLRRIHTQRCAAPTRRGSHVRSRDRSTFLKPLTDDVVRAADVVITMGCGDACPIHPGKRYEDWNLRDPADNTLEQAREVRDEIDARIRHLLGEILPASVTSH